MNKSKRTSVFEELHDNYHPTEPHSFIEVTEWSNGHGVDVVIDNNRKEMFQMTWGEFELFKKLMNKLD